MIHHYPEPPRPVVYLIECSSSPGLFIDGDEAATFHMNSDGKNAHWKVKDGNGVTAKRNVKSVHLAHIGTDMFFTLDGVDMQLRFDNEIGPCWMPPVTNALLCA